MRYYKANNENLNLEFSLWGYFLPFSSLGANCDSGCQETLTNSSQRKEMWLNCTLDLAETVDVGYYKQIRMVLYNCAAFMFPTVCLIYKCCQIDKEVNYVGEYFFCTDGV